MERKIKILHLEDLDSDSELINLELTKAHMNFENLVVDTRAEFISALHQFNPDIILADHSLNSFNSIEALGIVNENNPNIPFLVVTSTASDELLNSIITNGGKGYILKDNLDKLPGEIKTALDKVYLEGKGYPEMEVVITKEKLYDLRMLEEMDDHEYLVEILSIFLEETPRDLKEMQAAVRSKKYNAASEKAHKLKSSSGLLEAHKLTNILVQIEETSKSARMPNDLTGLVEAAISEYKEIEESLKNYLKTIGHKS